MQKHRLPLYCLWIVCLCGQASYAKYSVLLASFDSLKIDSSAPYVGIKLSHDSVRVPINNKPVFLRQLDSTVFNSLQMCTDNPMLVGVVVKNRIVAVDSAGVTVEMYVQQYKKMRNWKVGAIRKYPEVVLPRSDVAGYYYSTSVYGRLHTKRGMLIITLALVALLVAIGVSWYHNGTQ